MFRKFAILISIKRGFYVITPTTIKDIKAIERTYKYAIIFDTYQFTIEDLANVTKYIVGGYMATDNLGIMSQYLYNIISHYLRIIKTKRKDAYELSFVIKDTIYHSSITNLATDVANTIANLESETHSCCTIM
jgi:hypothetical protein